MNMYYLNVCTQSGEGFSCHVSATSHEAAIGKHLTDFPHHLVQRVTLLGPIR